MENGNESHCVQWNFFKQVHFWNAHKRGREQKERMMFQFHENGYNEMKIKKFKDGRNFAIGQHAGFKV